jgi:hypothetical protein
MPRQRLSRDAVSSSEFGLGPAERWARVPDRPGCWWSGKGSALADVSRTVEHVWVAETATGIYPQDTKILRAIAERGLHEAEARLTETAREKKRAACQQAHGSFRRKRTRQLVTAVRSNEHQEGSYIGLTCTTIGRKRGTSADRTRQDKTE